ncbi:30S ribosomal protein S17 [Candidatus Hepatobacter penaei]|uniref:30S ribosomal protein S17 n=1 Tax=Candidatus Hepatobacter penaei TaxID=1274402 RepID=UPI0004F276E4|nr:30S ribosomal protein S17 [Candidatus Hepatobacter penaei]TGW15897.1 30S ribosomal protein S17 [bacterium NHP-B]
MARRVLKGIVVSDKMNKTIQVLVERRFVHPVYGKIVKTRRKYAAHDEQNAFKVGDKVSILESKRYSRTKAWEVCAEKNG